MLKGRRITLVPLDAGAHAEALYKGFERRRDCEAVWTYLFDGPDTEAVQEFRANIEAKARSACIRCSSRRSTNASGEAVGYQTSCASSRPIA